MFFKKSYLAKPRGISAYLPLRGGVLSPGGEADHLGDVLRGGLDVNKRYQILLVGQQRAPLVAGGGGGGHLLITVAAVLILVPQGDGGEEGAAILFGLARPVMRL